MIGRPFLKKALLAMVIVLAVGISTAVANLAPPAPYDWEIGPIGKVTAESPFKMRLVVTTGEYPADAYGDQFEFEIITKEGLEVKGGA